jgi:hypothetical protein
MNGRQDQDLVGTGAQFEPQPRMPTVLTTTGAGRRRSENNGKQNVLDSSTVSGIHNLDRWIKQAPQDESWSAVTAAEP